MSITLTPHLNFTDGSAREALAFYREVFGGEVSVTTYAQLGMPAELPDADRVVFGRLVGAEGISMMAYDVPGGATPPVRGETRRENGLTLTDQPFFLSLGADTLDEARRRWELLLPGATVIEDLAASAWSAGFGMLQDRFGVTWVLSVAG
ncbi:MULTISPECIES: VOC family protein [Bacteria]|uniref:VOC family protein n=1 Tax=Bacteria TaxID=2 RepID=UPI003C7CF575